MSDTSKTGSPPVKIGGGPIRATRSYGLRPSPSTPLLPGSDGRKWGYATSSAIWWTAERSATAPVTADVARGKRLASLRSPPELSTVMRRSASFDAIATSYLSGRWPCRADPASSLACLVTRPIVLTLDKFTQTPFDWDEVDAGGGVAKQRTPTHKRCPSQSNVIKESRVQSNKCKEGTTLVGGLNVRSSPVSSSRAIMIPSICRRNPLMPCQGSAEGFNQEIERLVRNTNGLDGEHDPAKVPTPDGHRAPIADQLLRVRSIDTQTPSSSFPLSSIDRHFPRVLGSDDSPLSTLPIIPGDCDDSEPEDNKCNFDVTAAIDKIRTSPLFVCFVESIRQREPPDGCEQQTKVKMATSEHWRDVFRDTFIEQSPVITQCHIPSERSAFCPLLKNYVGHQLALTTVAAGNSTVEAQ